MQSKAFRVVNRVMAVLFVICAIIQYNDPDPLGWTALYAAAGFACLAAARFRRGWLLPAGVGLVAFGWAVWLSPILANLRIRNLARTMHAETPSIELSREFLGLVIVLGWMVVLAVDSRRKSPRVQSGSSLGESPGR